MFEIRKTVELDAGHRIPFHSSKCRNLHGHRYKVTAVVAAMHLVPEELKESESGMVADFGHIKQILMEEIHDPYDHKFMVWEKDSLWEWLGELDEMESLGFVKVPCIPTAEGLANYWARKVDLALRADYGSHLWLRALKVYETPTSVATKIFG